MLGLDYSSSEDEGSRKRPRTAAAPRASTELPTVKRRKPAALPRLPDSYETVNPTDDPAQHQGRVRAKPFVSGDYYAHVYVELPVDATSRARLDAIIASARDSLPGRDIHSFLERNSEDPSDPPASSSSPASTPALHVSLTHPLPLRGDLARSFSTRLSSALTQRKTAPFDISLSVPKIYHNSSSPRRAFLALRIGAGSRELREILDKVLRPVLDGFHVEAYFDTPEWHASIAWCLDDAQDIPPETSPFPPNILDILQCHVPTVLKLPAWKVRELCVKVGKDVVRIPLRQNVDA